MSKVVVLGDLILDKFTFGVIERMNKEAPIPIFLITEERYLLGSSGKAAEILKALNEEVFLIGTIGKDVYGKKLKEILRKKGIKFKLIESKKRTIIKERFVSKTHYQQLFRADIEDRNYLTSSNEKEVISEITKFDPEYIIVLDYAIGTLTPIVISELKTKYKIYVHTKPKHIAFYKNVNLLKPNYEDLNAVVKSSSIETQLMEISNLFSSPVMVNEKNKKIYLTHNQEVLTEEIKEPNTLLGIEDYLVSIYAYYHHRNNNIKKSFQETIKKINKLSKEEILY